MRDINYAMGDRTYLRLIEAGSMFWFDERLYSKTGVTKDKGTFYLCHPVSPSELCGYIVQEKVNTWLAVGAVVDVAIITPNT